MNARVTVVVEADVVVRSGTVKLRFLNLSLLLIGFTIAACSNTTQTSGSVPTPSNPASGTQTTLTVPTPSQNPNIPDLTNAVPINLVDKTSYSGLMDISSGQVYPPLVGDPLIDMQLTSGGGTVVNGQVLVAFEDSQEFWGAELPSFNGMGTALANSLDMTFADEDLVVRVIGSISSGTLNGNIYYRVRQSGEIACENVTVTCELSGYIYATTSRGVRQLIGHSRDSSQCNTNYDTVTPCQQYVDTSNPQVKQLGSFEATYSNWAQ